jgi:hypothetical protein
LGEIIRNSALKITYLKIKVLIFHLIIFPLMV